MRKTDLVEATNVLSAILLSLQGSCGSTSSAGVSDLNYAVGQLQAFAPKAIDANWLGVPLAQCFKLARVAGATLSGIAAVRAFAGALSPRGSMGQAIAVAAVRFALVQEAKILARMTFVSRDDVDACITTYDAAFDAAETEAADALQINAYRTLVKLHAAVMRDLTVRARPLPSMVQYAYGRSYSAIGLAQRLFGDPTEALNLVQENKVAHPYFMPLSGRALAG